MTFFLFCKFLGQAVIEIFLLGLSVVSERKNKILYIYIYIYIYIKIFIILKTQKISDIYYKQCFL